MKNVRNSYASASSSTRSMVLTQQQDLAVWSDFVLWKQWPIDSNPIQCVFAAQEERVSEVLKTKRKHNVKHKKN